MADRLITLGLPDLAREQASQWATQRTESLARRGAPPPAANEGDTFLLEPDLLASTLTLGIDITPEDLISARRNARNGRPDQLMGIYDEMVRFGPGPQINKCVRKLSGATFSFLPPEEFRSEDDKSPDAKLARDIAAAVGKQYKPHVGAAMGHAFGKYSHGIVGLHQIVEARGAENGRERVVSIEKVPSRRFEIDTLTQELLYRPFALTTQAVPVRPFIESGNLVIFQESADAEPLDRRGLLFQCLIVWVMASFGVRWLARLAELCGIPYRMIWYDSTKPGQKKLASDIGKKMGAAGWGALPKGMEVKLLNALSTTGGAGEIHEKLINLAARVYDQVFFGHSQASNVEVGAGSRTSSDNASEQADEQHQSRADQLATDFTEGLIRPYVRRNYGDDVAARLCPVLVAEIKQKKNPKLISEVVLNLSKAGARKIDEEDAIRACGLVVAADESRALAPLSVPEVKPAQLQTENVIPFPTRLSMVDAAPDGIGEEIVAPYRTIIQRSVREGASADQILSRIRDRSEAETPELQDHLATLMLNGLMGGITAVRKARARKAQ